MRILKIGRVQGNDIILNSSKVSSVHAELTILNSGDMMLEDKGSTNGTFVMNQAIKPGKLVSVRRGDAIRFADVELNWAQVPMPEDNSAYKGIYGIGTKFNNEIQLSGSTVSRYHATVKQRKDGKMYIFDHSKNGTTVNGAKIASNTPILIKKSDAVVCGGVPADLSRLPWSSDPWKIIAKIAAIFVLVVGVGYGIYSIINGSDHRKMSPQQIYDRYNKSVVMLKGIYHFDVTIGDLDIDKFNSTCAKLIGEYIPKKMLPVGNKFVPVDKMSNKEIVSAINELSNDKGLYSGTGFFISQDGKLVTNLHIVKPWLGFNKEDNVEVQLQRSVAQYFSSIVGKLTTLSDSYKYSYLNAYLTEVKVKGVLDYIALVPQGEVFDSENLKKCKVLYSDGETFDDGVAIIQKDVALIQMVKKNIPEGCTYVNVQDSMFVGEEAYNVGNSITTVGFPLPSVIQNYESEDGIQVSLHSGDISKKSDAYSFVSDAVSGGGASGSPIFSNRGMLIGVLYAGVGTKNMTYGIKAKYVKEMLDNYNSKK